MGAYRWSPADIGMLLVEILLEFWELIQVPVFLTQSFPGIPKLPLRRPTSTSSETWGTAISVAKIHTN